MPITDSGATRRRLVDRVAIGILIGVVAISVGGAALLTVYLNRIGDAAEGLHRVDGLGAYDGRPEPVVVDGVSAVNYLLMTTDEAGELQAVVIAHLSATRRDLTLISLPADLLVDDGARTATLAASFTVDPRLTARAVENVTGARMDHQVQLGMDGFSNVVDVLGGIDLGHGRMDGAQVIAALAAAPDRPTRSMMTAKMLKGAMSQASVGVAITDPTRFEKVVEALTPCLTVDAQLTSDEIRSTMVESRVRTDKVEALPLAATTTGAGTEPDPTKLAELRDAFATDALTAQPVPATQGSVASTPGMSGIASGTSTGPSAWPSATPTQVESPASTSSASVGPKVDVASPTATR